MNATETEADHKRLERLMAPRSATLREKAGTPPRGGVLFGSVELPTR